MRDLVLLIQTLSSACKHRTGGEQGLLRSRAVRVHKNRKKKNHKLLPGEKKNIYCAAFEMKASCRLSLARYKYQPAVSWLPRLIAWSSYFVWCSTLLPG